MSIKIEGLEELNKLLDDLPRKVMTDFLERAAHDAGTCPEHNQVTTVIVARPVSESNTQGSYALSACCEAQQKRAADALDRILGRGES